MADQNRKNIYIPEDQTEMFKQAEEFARSNNISLSTLVVKAVSNFVLDEVRKQGEVSLMIKTYDEHPVIPTIKCIKFIGELVVKSDYIADEVHLREDGSLHIGENAVCDPNNYREQDTVYHVYTIYKTQKGKYLVYVDRKHSRTYIDFMGEYDDDQTIKQQCSYKIYDNLKELVEDLGDLDGKTIDELAKNESTTEYLDI